MLPSNTLLSSYSLKYRSTSHQIDFCLQQRLLQKTTIKMQITRDPVVLSPNTIPAPEIQV